MPALLLQTWRVRLLGLPWQTLVSSTQMCRRWWPATATGTLHVDRGQCMVRLHSIRFTILCQLRWWAELVLIRRSGLHLAWDQCVQLYSTLVCVHGIKYYILVTYLIRVCAICYMRLVIAVHIPTPTSICFHIRNGSDNHCSSHSHSDFYLLPH